MWDAEIQAEYWRLSMLPNSNLYFRGSLCTRCLLLSELLTWNNTQKEFSGASLLGPQLRLLETHSTIARPQSEELPINHCSIFCTCLWKAPTSLSLLPQKSSPQDEANRGSTILKGYGHWLCPAALSSRNALFWISCKTALALCTTYARSPYVAHIHP